MLEYIVEIEHVYKSFPGVKALDDVSFHLKSGEVLALLGENGAGKSTLMKVLSGIYTRDSGDITIFGEKIGVLTPKKAQELGVAIIHQELNMCAHLSIAENIFLGREKSHSGLLSNKEMNKQAKAILDRLNIDLDPETIVGDLTVSKQQMVEIAKALSTNAKILIMDEPTSALTSKEIDDLFGIIRKLRDEGCGIVYISHRLEELQYIVDRVTIMRDGRHITTMNFAETTMQEIIENMVGREIKEKFPKVVCERGKKILEIKNLNVGRLVRDISFDIYEGEIVGIAGLLGAGRTETTRAIFGVDPKESGEIILNGEPLTINKPMDAIKAGIVLAPEDRKKDGLCTKLSVRDNIALPNLDILCNALGVVNKGKEDEMVEDTISKLTIKLPNAEVDAISLSGGNQQKVVVGKWLARNSHVVIFDEPTRGIDVAAKVEIYNLMNDLKMQGIGVFFISSEMPEIMGISDRILVMCDGRITGELNIEDATQNLILEYATKFDSKVITSNAQ
ncbi:sugar ABC transporter ATP-binding protein [Hydrogenoanaerobacterium sp.]|uniref:sugar ABC transporter ATP-binding protein n=1 Tax=Hydrogenoanaerobacterium sp. TaxID=2953763 RepID=UPI0028A08824|nr:sugar ABC transporter ATP-binding protein [Hydrogenoanaerobacterium sp.]